MKTLVKILFFLIDPLRKIKDPKAFRGVMIVYIILCMVIGHAVVELGQEYIPIAWHKIFKTDVMDKPAPVTVINSDLPNIESTVNE